MLAPAASFAAGIRFRPGSPLDFAQGRHRSLLQPPRLLAKSEGSGCRIMSTSEPKRIGVSFEVKPHAYDPSASPELFDGVVARRIIAFVIDLIILAIPIVLLSMFIFVIGVVTLGFGFILYALLSPIM